MSGFKRSLNAVLLQDVSKILTLLEKKLRIAPLFIICSAQIFEENL
jgi:hypothetical protein